MHEIVFSVVINISRQVLVGRLQGMRRKNECRKVKVNQKNTTIGTHLPSQVARPNTFMTAMGSFSAIYGN